MIVPLRSQADESANVQDLEGDMAVTEKTIRIGVDVGGKLTPASSTMHKPWH